MDNLKGLPPSNTGTVRAIGACAILSVISFPALASSFTLNEDLYVYRQPMSGVEHSSDYEQDIRKCILPRNVNIGKRGLFCGHESEGSLVYVGDVDGRSILFAPSDEGNYEWATYNMQTNANSLYNGMLNTIHIVSNYDSPANEICHQKGEGWYLPALYELKLLLDNKEKINLGSIGIYDVIQGNDPDPYLEGYWTSTEIDRYSVNRIEFYADEIDYGTKTYNRRVRCARSY